MTFSNPDGTQAVVSRVLHAPVTRVFRAFTDPDDMAAWMWGPLAANTVAEVDLRVGGRYRVTIDATPDRGEWPGDRWSVGGVYVIVAPDERLVYTVHWDAPVGYNEDPTGPVFDEVMLVDFTPAEEGTRLDIRHVGIPDDGVSAAEHGRALASTVDYLAAVVETSA